MNKQIYISDLYKETCTSIASDREKWKSFLETACNNYKLRFDELVLIYAQRPDATAVLEIEKWNKTFNRWVNRGAKGIAVFDDSKLQTRLKYYFDVSDTHEGRLSIEVPIWKMKPEYEQEVIEALESAYGELEDKTTLQRAVLSAATNGTDDNIGDYIDKLVDIKSSSLLTTMDENELFSVLRNTAIDSINYLISKRLDLEPAMDMKDSFQWVQYFNTVETLNVLGFATRDISEIGLYEIAKVIRNLDKNQKRIIAKGKDETYNIENQMSLFNIDNSRGDENGTTIQRRERSNDSGSEHGVRGELEVRNLGNEEKELPNEPSESDVLQPANNDEIKQLSKRSRDAVQGDGRELNREHEEIRGDNRDSEGREADGMGEQDGQHLLSSQGNRHERTDLLNVEYSKDMEGENSLPFFNVNLTDFIRSYFSQNELETMDLLYSSVTDKDERLEYLKRLFSSHNGQPDGCNVTIYKNGLRIANLEDNKEIESVFYRWEAIDSTIRGMLLTNELFQEQDNDALLFSQELIDAVLVKGANIVDSKYRIYHQFQQSLSSSENIKFLKSEYGEGGSSEVIRGTDISESHSAKGILLSRGYLENRKEYNITWKYAEKRISQLIKLERYMNENELKEYSRWQTEKEESELQRNKPATYETTSYEYHLGDVVYIGTLKYEVVDITDTTVKLYDETFPLLNKEMPIDEFERKIKETPGNEHLAKKESPVETIKTEEIKSDNEEIEEVEPEIVEKIPKIGSKKNYKLDINNQQPRTKKEIFNDNIEAIKVMQTCKKEGRNATLEEQTLMSKYQGWGGIPEAFDSENNSWSNEYKMLKDLLDDEAYKSARESTLTSFYTPNEVITSMYKAISRMGFEEGNILEPSCGTGNFIGSVPSEMSDSKFYGVEIDESSGEIAKLLYPESNINIEGFEKTNLPDSFFDVVIGNVPFGDYKLYDKAYDKENFLIHDYFFAKSLDKLRPGGIMAFVTSKGTLDKANPSFRKYIAQRADLLGAIRLPNNTFEKDAKTVVTSDIVFLQKRDLPSYEEPDWVFLDKDENGITMNSYFVNHPEMILGQMSMVPGRFGEETACLPYDESDIGQLLDEAINNIHAEFVEAEYEEIESEDESIVADPEVKNFSYTLVDGQVYFRENSRMYKQDLPDTAKSRIKGMIAIRDALRDVIDSQVNDYEESQIKAAQEKLNNVYDTFSKKYGLINSRANSSAFSDDSSYYLLSALEILDEEGKFKCKADIFNKRTISANKVVEHCDTLTEALSVSIGEKAKVDLDYIGELTGKSRDEIVKGLDGIIFKSNEDPELYLQADEYLSGNVREKLKIAKVLAENDSSYATNVKMLEQVQPKDLEAAEIGIRLGATWIPEDVINSFVFELLDTPGYAKWNIKVKYMSYTGEWNIQGKNNDKGNVNAYTKYGTARVNAYKIIEETLNLKDVRVYDYPVDDTGKKTRVLNKKETAIAQQKQELIKQNFVDWVWKDPERRERLTTIYNERFNAIRPREFNGEHLIFSGMNTEIQLREHQKNAIAHILYGGNTLLAHAVGAGKTYEMVAAAMESKRLGLCNKSLFVVPNHLTEQWAAEFLQLYPSANILVAKKKDFQTKNRKKFCSRIATCEFDAIIIGHSQFEKIPMSVEFQKDMLEHQLEEITDGIQELKYMRGERLTIKALEKTKKQVKQKLEKLNNQDRKDDVINFEELGIDRLFIDESHYYKNLYLYTKMRNVGGIAQTEAQKSSDLFMKCRYLDSKTNGRGVVFATGTPISNSMVELYTIQRYLQYETLEKYNLQHFDAWASTFGETITAIELAPEGYTSVG